MDFLKGFLSSEDATTGEFAVEASDSKGVVGTIENVAALIDIVLSFLEKMLVLLNMTDLTDLSKVIEG